ncbi:MAG: PQQ-binding-like beta-propeller repeat protein [Euryarchaeota archaeon]|nr:PQQ-binding-like beta-propeller repeat protein [Euryarchaeota archaeon]
MGNDVRSGRPQGRAATRPSRRKAPRGRRAVLEPFHNVSCGPTHKNRRGGRQTRHGLVLFVLLVASLFAALLAAPAFAQVDPAIDSEVWKRTAPQERGSPLRAGSVDVELASGNASTIRWQVDGFKPFLAGAVMDEENAYVVDNKGNVSAVQLATGDLLWSRELKSAVSATPTVAYGRLYVATEAKKLHVLSVRSGQELTATTLGGIARAAPLAADGKIYQGNDAGVLEVFDALTLDLIWKFDTATLSFKANGEVNKTDVDLRKPIRAPPAFYDGKVYLAAWNGKVYKLSATGNIYGNPTMHWNVSLGDVVNAAPAVDHRNEVLYVAAADGTLIALRLSTGQVRWQFSGGSAFQSGAAVGNDTLYAGTSLGRLIKTDQNGKLLWDQIAEGQILTAPTITKDALVVATADGTVTLRSPTDGNVLSDAKGRLLQWQLPDGLSGELAVTQKGVLVVDLSGTLTLIGPEPDEKADLVATNIDTTGPRQEGHPLNLTIDYTNEGPHPALLVTVTVSVDGSVLKSEKLPRLNRGETRNWATSLDGLTAGDRSVRVAFTPIGAADPDPERAAISIRVPIEEPEEPAMPVDSSGEIDYAALYGDDANDTGEVDADPTTASAGTPGFGDGFGAAWGWIMVPVALAAIVGGAYVGIRHSDRLPLGKKGDAGADADDGDDAEE